MFSYRHIVYFHIYLRWPFFALPTPNDALLSNQSPSIVMSHGILNICNLNNQNQDLIK